MFVNHAGLQNTQLKTLMIKKLEMPSNNQCRSSLNISCEIFLAQFQTTFTTIFSLGWGLKNITRPIIR